METIDNETLEKDSERLAAMGLEPVHKKRADAGKQRGPREALYVTIPGVRWDLNQDNGRKAFSEWASHTTDTSAIADVLATLLAEIDKLKAR